MKVIIYRPNNLNNSGELGQSLTEFRYNGHIFFSTPRNASNYSAELANKFRAQGLGVTYCVATATGETEQSGLFIYHKYILSFGVTSTSSDSVVASKVDAALLSLGYTRHTIQFTGRLTNNVFQNQSSNGIIIPPRTNTNTNSNPYVHVPTPEQYSNAIRTIRGTLNQNPQPAQTTVDRYFSDIWGGVSNAANGAVNTISEGGGFLSGIGQGLGISTPFVLLIGGVVLVLALRR